MPHLGPSIFDNANPLIVVIEPDANGVWQIQPSKDDKVTGGGPGNGSIHRDIASGRALEMKPVAGPAWTLRRSAGASVDPTFFHEDHVPIVLIPGEKVKFKCARPFVIWLDRDPNVSIVTGTPQNPLGITLPVTGNGGNSPVFNVVGCGQQVFYKCTAYVDLGTGETLVIDPDTIIDF
jgi:hypothetical protein